MFNRLSRLIVLTLVILAILVPHPRQRGWAQDAYQARLSNTDASRFPHIAAALDVRDGQGEFVAGLQAHQLSVLEDGRRLPVDTLEELHAGAQLVVAVNPGRAFGIRDALGVSRFDLLTAALQAWAGGRPPHAADDLSLLVTGGTEILHTVDAQDLLDTLAIYQEDVRTAQPSLRVLERAFEVVTDPTPRLGMGRAVLFITPPLEAEGSGGIPNLIALSQQHDVRVFVWLVTSPEVAQAGGAGPLQALVEQSHGQLFTYSGSEALPSIDDYLGYLGSIYHLSYTSQANSSGPHQAFIEMELGGATVASSPTQYDLSILPPKVVFVSPPTTIQRTVKADALAETESLNLADQLSPHQQPLEVLIEFPDGFPRPVISSTLFVDGNPVARNVQEPFGLFSWDLNAYHEAGEHVLRVEVMDTLLLTGTTVEKTVQVGVEYPAQGIFNNLIRRGPLITGLVVVLAGSVLLLVLIFSGRLGPPTPAARATAGWGARLGARRNGQGRRWLQKPVRRSDPVTQPVPMPPTEARDTGTGHHWMDRFAWQHKPAVPKALAYLTHLADEESEKTLVPIPLDGDVIFVGKDPARVTLALDDPSLEGVHSRLMRQGDSYRLCDEGSVAGTWVNYAPVSTEGIRLEHGDLVHIGRVGFRFTLREPARLPKPVVHTEDKVP